MTVRNLITRVDDICRKYDKCDVDKQKQLNNVACGDAFARFYGAVGADVDATEQKSVAAANEKNRALAIALNADIQRRKSLLPEEIPKLQRLVLKRVKGVSKEENDDRSDLVSALKERIESIRDGTKSRHKQTGSWATSSSQPAIKIDSTSDGKFQPDFFQQTEEANRFRKEYEMRKLGYLFSLAQIFQQNILVLHEHGYIYERDPLTYKKLRYEFLLELIIRKNTKENTFNFEI